MKKLLTLAVAALVSLSAAAQTQVIAHRGFHATEGSARNSMASLKEAQKLGLFGSECDINLTKDNIIVVAHGAWHPKKGAEGALLIQKSTYEELKGIALENGEIMPTLDEYLAQVKKDPKTKLIIEIKDHATPQRETEIVEMAVKKVAEYGLEDAVEYIAFRPFVCTELHRVAPSAKVAYLNGNYEPAYVKAMGLTGIDYKFSVLEKKPKWIKAAQKIGLTVNVWTVDKEEDLRWCVEQGVNYITTDDPILANKVIAEAKQ